MTTRPPLTARLTRRRATSTVGVGLRRSAQSTRVSFTPTRCSDSCIRFTTRSGSLQQMPEHDMMQTGMRDGFEQLGSLIIRQMPVTDALLRGPGAFRISF